MQGRAMINAAKLYIQVKMREQTYLVDRRSNSSMSTTVAGTEVWRRPGTLETALRKPQAKNRESGNWGGRAVEGPVIASENSWRFFTHRGANARTETRKVRGRRTRERVQGGTRGEPGLQAQRGRVV